MEESMLVELDLLLGVGGTEDATALAAVVTAVEEREGCLAARLSAHSGGGVVLFAKCQ